MATLYPVHFQDAETGQTLGWVAMPVMPVVDDGVQITALPNGRVTSRRWEQVEVPSGAMSMVQAGLVTPGIPQWVAVVSLGDFESED